MTQEALEGWVLRAAAGDEVAWQRLWAELEPALMRIVAQPRFLGRLGQREDDRRNIIVELMARLRIDGFARLGRYVAAKRDNPELRFMTWLRVVAKRVGIDYMRRHPEYVDRRHVLDGEPGQWVEMEPLSAQVPGARAAVSDHGLARRLIEYAAHAIPAGHRRALTLWAHGATFDDIATDCELGGRDDAERAVRAAIERLRRRFRDLEDAA